MSVLQVNKTTKLELAAACMWKTRVMGRLEQQGSKRVSTAVSGRSNSANSSQNRQLQSPSANSWHLHGTTRSWSPNGRRTRRYIRSSSTRRSRLQTRQWPTRCQVAAASLTLLRAWRWSEGPSMPGPPLTAIHWRHRRQSGPSISNRMRATARQSRPTRIRRRLGGRDPRGWDSGGVQSLPPATSTATS